jgi:hypothetical protein
MFTRVFTRVRSYRAALFEIVFLAALLGVAHVAQLRGATVAARADPGIAAVDSALAALILTVDMQADPIDPRVRALVERRQELIAERKSRLAFWPGVRFVSLMAFVSNCILVAFSVVSRWLGNTAGGASRPVRQASVSSADPS